jgi:16S rRNA C967 or C1407 C5-methylase (RsmB/RsmF family)
MKKYEQLEAQIKEIQKEVERLKQEEANNKLPDAFKIDEAKEVIRGNVKFLMLAFRWRDTLEGSRHWSDIFSNRKKLSNADIIQIQRWIITAQENLLN